MFRLYGTAQFLEYITLYKIHSACLQALGENQFTAAVVALCALPFSALCLLSPVCGMQGCMLAGNTSSLFTLIDSCLLKGCWQLYRLSSPTCFVLLQGHLYENTTSVGVRERAASAVLAAGTECRPTGMCSTSHKSSSQETSGVVYPFYLFSLSLTVQAPGQVPHCRFQ